MLQIGIVGFGWWGRHIAARLKDHHELSVRAVAEPDLSKHEEIRNLGISQVADTTELLADPGIEAVILTSPNRLHDSQVVDCANAGKHVFCEKPLSLTAEGARSSIASCADAGVVLGVGHERRFEPAIQALKAHLDAGDLGVVMHAELAFSHNKLKTLDSSSWRTSRHHAPAAGMTQMGIHLSDLLIWFFGPVATVQAVTADRSLGWETGDLLTVQIQFQAGMTATMQAILNTPHFLRTHIFGSEEWIEIRNETHPDTPGGKVEMLRYRELADQKSQSFEWSDAVLANLEAWAGAIRGKASYPISDFEKLHNIEVLEAVIASAKSGETVRL